MDFAPRPVHVIVNVGVVVNVDGNGNVNEAFAAPVWSLLF